MNSHIDDIIGLIDKVLGPDDGGPVPYNVNSYGDAHRNYGDDRYYALGESPPACPLREIRPRGYATRGSYRTNELDRLTLADLERHLGSRTERGLSNNTKVSRDYHGKLIIVLHQTAIITYDREVEGEITMTLNSGGWHTTTTKQRLNALLPAKYQVFSNKFDWFVRLRSVDGADQTIAFHDGMKIYTTTR